MAYRTPTATARNSLGPLPSLTAPPDPPPGLPPPDRFQRRDQDPLGSRHGYASPNTWRKYLTGGGAFQPDVSFDKDPLGKVGDRPPPEPKNPTGSESGPGILESWFNQRASGIDAASQYATRRGLDALNDRYAAAGMANSGAARQGDSDLLANIEAQRAGQLDALAAGASGEHQRRLDSMFGQGLGIAGGQSQINSAYDLRAAQVQSDALSAALNYFMNKEGVDDKSRQAGLNNILGIWGAATS